MQTHLSVICMIVNALNKSNKCKSKLLLVLRQTQEINKAVVFYIEFQRSL